MKKIITIFTSLLALIAMTASAQDSSTTIAINENLEISNSNLIFRYYFFPNLEAYYDNKTSDYVYKINGN